MFPTLQSCGGVPGTVCFGSLVLLTLLAFGHSMWRRYRVLVRARVENRLDRLPARVWMTIKYGLLQLRMFKDPYAGLMHMLIFSGFVVLSVRTAGLIVEGFVPGFDVLKGAVGQMYNLVKDVVEVLVLAGVAMAIYRRGMARPKRLDSSLDAWFILVLIGFLIIADLVADAARIRLEPSRGGWWSPATGILALALPESAASSVRHLFAFCWWAHLIAVFSFANYLPYSKHFHILAAIPNIFAQNLSPMGRLPIVSLENVETFGASKVEDFTWKALLDSYACTECGRCRESCPTVLTGKPLDPKGLMVSLRGAVYEGSRVWPSRRRVPSAGAGKRETTEAAVNPLIGGWISEDAIWACTTCGYCTTACPVFIVPAVEKIVEMRRHLVLDRAEFPKEIQAAFRGLETNGNPWGIGAASRADWAKGLPVTTMAQAGNSKIEYLFWVGCAGSYEDRARRVSKALVEILDRAGVKFAILGTEETCTGDSARRVGNEYLFQTLAQKNIRTLNGYGVRKIVTNCPHCYNCLKNEYPQFGGNYEVVHGSELVAELVDRGRVSLERELAGSITFHDPCYLGRYNHVYDAPRKVLEAIPGLELKEAARTRDEGLCCGAGGGRMWMEEKLGERINQARMKEIAAVGTDKVGVSCPFCMVMIDNAKDELAAGPPVFDVLELARAAMVPRESPPT